MSRKPRLGQANPALGTLYNAPDVQEARRLRGGIAELQADQILTEGRLDDRLLLEVEGLKESIAQNGQRVPILVRPGEGDRYRLVYGRRRLEAARQLGRPVRAIITDLDEDQALRDQLLENVERRDLSFIERALVAVALLQGDQLAASERSNKGVAEVLNLTEAGVSQLISVVRTVGDELVQAIGAAPGIGRPRWEELKRALSPAHVPVTELVSRALAVRTDETTAPGERSDQAFLAVLAASRPALPVTEPAAPATEDAIQLDGIGSASLRRSARGKRLQLDLRVEDRRFIDWFEGNAPELIRELHGRWQRSGT